LSTKQKNQNTNVETCAKCNSTSYNELHSPCLRKW